MDLRPWNYWIPRRATLRGNGRDRVEPGEGARAEPQPSRCATTTTSTPWRRTRRGRRRPRRTACSADAGGGPHGAHALAHLPARGPLRRRRRRPTRPAIVADEDYITQCRAQGLYPMAYYPHNIHFLWFAASADGRSQLAIESARKTASKVSDELLDPAPAPGAASASSPSTPSPASVSGTRCSRSPPPARQFLYLQGMWHYARGLAFLGKDQPDDADRSWPRCAASPRTRRSTIRCSRPTPRPPSFRSPPRSWPGRSRPGARTTTRRSPTWTARFAWRTSLVYTEPSEWHYPPRLALGAVLLSAGRAKEAETVYWEDLRRNRDNGWALFGLAQAQRAQGRADEAAATQTRFEKAWARADVKLGSSRF